MEMIHFSLCNLWKKSKDAYFFAFAIVATACVITIFFSIINNPYYGQSMQDKSNLQSTHMYLVDDGTGNMVKMYQSETNLYEALERGVGDGIFIMMLSLVIIGICTMVIFFANSFFLLSKTKDVGIMMVSGNTIPRIAKFFIIQNFALILVFAPFGAVFGLAFSPLINQFIYSAMNIEASIFTFTPFSALESFVSLCMIGCWLVLVDAGYVYRMYSLLDLLKVDKRIKATYKNKLWIMPIIYVCVYIIGIGLFYTFPTENVIFLFMFYVGFFIYFGYMNIFRFVLPAILAWIRKHFCVGSKYLSIAIGNLQYSIKGASNLAMLTLLSTSIIMYYAGNFYSDAGTFSVLMVAYYACLMLICFCFTYKILVDSVSKESIFLNMQRIGYLKKDMKKIIRMEVICFYICFIVLSLPQLWAILLAYVEDGLAPMSFIYEITWVFCIALFCTGILTNIVYQKLIYKKINTRSLARD